MSYNAIIRTLQIQADQPNLQVVNSEGFVAVSPAALESEISWWRRQNQLYGDLLLEPTYFRENSTIPEDFIHFAPVRRQMGRIRASDFIRFRYHLTSLNGLRATELKIVPLSIEKFKKLPHPPLEIARHSNPFEVSFELLFPFNPPSTPIPLWLANFE